MTDATDAPKGKGASPFDSAMDRSPNPGVGADAGDEDDGADASAKGILAASRASTGRKSSGSKN